MGNQTSGLLAKAVATYDNYLRRLTQRGAQSVGLRSVGFGAIFIAVAPFFAAIFVQSVIIAAFGSGGFLLSTIMNITTILLAGGLFYSGFKVVYYKSQQNKKDQD